MDKYGPPPLNNYERYLSTGEIKYSDEEYEIAKIEKLNVDENTTKEEVRKVVVMLAQYTSDFNRSVELRKAATAACFRLSDQFKEMQRKRHIQLEEQVSDLGIF